MIRFDRDLNYGSNRINNLTLACHTCNETKGHLSPDEWIEQLAQSPSTINQQRLKSFSNVAKGIKPSMRDAAVMNALRHKLVQDLFAFNLPIELGSGGLTKFNRTQQNYPKAHWIDAACIGASGDNVIISSKTIPLAIKAMGRGSRQMCRMNQYGFPRTSPKQTGAVNGFKTGDCVKAIVTKGKKQGAYVGRVAVRASGSFNITTNAGTVQGIGTQYCRLLQRNDGYQYSNLKNPITVQKTTNASFPPLTEVRGFHDASIKRAKI